MSFLFLFWGKSAQMSLFEIPVSADSPCAVQCPEAIGIWQLVPTTSHKFSYRTRDKREAPQQAVQASPAGVTQHKEAQAWPTRQPASKTRRRRSSPGKEMRKRPTKAEAFICVPLKKFVITYRPLKS